MLTHQWQINFTNSQMTGKNETNQLGNNYLPVNREN